MITQFIAQTVDLAQTDAPAPSSGTSSLLFLAVMAGIFYLLIFRPQRRRMKQQQELQRAVTTGDEVQTIGGIRGRVTSMTDDEVILQLEDGRMRLSKKAIARRLTDDSETD